MQIKDSVHGYIEVPDTFEPLLDAPALQRLREIRQLSTVQFAYPAANHTRFEHSLGVFHLTQRAVDTLDIPAELGRRLQAAALVHDVGHGPFGHQTEPVIERHLGRHHDSLGWLLVDSDLAAAIRACGCDPEAVADTVAGEGPYGELISSAIDVDRVDYLLRDAHHTGVPYGTIDPAGVIRAFDVSGEQVVIDHTDRIYAETVVIARQLMNVAVYRHHISRIAGAMLERASERLLAERALAPATFARLTDAQLLARLREHDATAAVGDRLANRRLYKRAVWTPFGETPAELVDLPFEEARGLAAEIAETAGVAASRVIVDSPGLPAAPEREARIATPAGRQSLAEASALAAGLDEFAAEHWHFGVYTPAEHREVVHEAAETVLGLATPQPPQ